MKKRDKILREAKTRLVAAFGDKIKDVVLFGSRAWGKPHRWSDWASCGSNRGLKKS